MYCEWMKCARPAAKVFCGKLVCLEHSRTVEEVGIREARRILNVDDMVVTGSCFIGGATMRRVRSCLFKKESLQRS